MNNDNELNAYLEMYVNTFAKQFDAKPEHVSISYANGKYTVKVTSGAVEQVVGPALHICSAILSLRIALRSTDYALRTKSPITAAYEAKEIQTHAANLHSLLEDYNIKAGQQ